MVRTADDWALVRLSPVHKDIIKEKRALMMMMIGHMVAAVTDCDVNDDDDDDDGDVAYGHNIAASVKNGEKVKMPK